MDFDKQALARYKNLKEKITLIETEKKKRKAEIDKEMKKRKMDIKKELAALKKYLLEMGLIEKKVQKLK